MNAPHERIFPRSRRQAVIDLVTLALATPRKTGLDFC